MMLVLFAVMLLFWLVEYCYLLSWKTEKKWIIKFLANERLATLGSSLSLSVYAEMILPQLQEVFFSMPSL